MPDASMGLIGTMAAASVAFIAAFAAIASLLPKLVARHRDRFAHSVGRALRGSFLFIDTTALHRLLIVSAVVLAVLAWLVTAQPLASIAMALSVGLAPRLLLARLRRRYVDAFRAQFPDLMMLTAGAVRAGNSLQQAIASAAAEMPSPARQEIGLMLREQRLGTSLADSLAALQRRMRLEETALFASALRIGTESGGNVADALETLSDTSRKKLALEGKIRALTAQGRLQAIVMAALPSVLAVIITLIDPEAMRPLIADWQGWVVCLGVIGAQIAGYLMIRRLVLIEI